MWWWDDKRARFLITPLIVFEGIYIFSDEPHSTNWTIASALVLVLPVTYLALLLRGWRRRRATARQELGHS